LLKITNEVRLLDQEISQKRSAIEKIESQIRIIRKDQEDEKARKEPFSDPLMDLRLNLKKLKISGR